MSTVPADAVALGAARVMADGSLRTYTPISFRRNPHGGCSMWVRRAKVKGLTDTRRCREPYAILDVFNEDGDIVADFAIPDASCFRYLYSKLGWRVEDEQ